MTTVRQLLEQKGSEVWTIRPDDTVAKALAEMRDRDIGSLVVVDEEGRVVGMFTERHYARNVFLKGRSSPTTRVAEVMRADPLYVRPDQDIRECVSLVTYKRVRHLPVLDGSTLVGLVSIGDLLKATIAAREFDVEQLVRYVSEAG